MILIVQQKGKKYRLNLLSLNVLEFTTLHCLNSLLTVAHLIKLSEELLTAGVKQDGQQ